MNTDRESQCIKYERDVQLGEATRKAHTGKVLRSAQGSRCQTENLSVSNTKEMMGQRQEPNSAAREGYKESAYRKGLEISPFQKRVSDYRERLKVVDVRDDCCNCVQ